MGNVYRGLPPYLVDVAKKIGISRAWETGTYLGETTVLLAHAFDEVSTVEASENLWKSTKRQFENVENIYSYFGDSPTILRQKLSQGQNYFFWLDAHWSGDITFGEGEACPVLKELESIKKAKLGSCNLVCIDDARLFSAPHQLAPLMNGWPRMSEILLSLEEMGLRTFVFDDVILGISPEYEDFLMNHMLEMIVSREQTKTVAHLGEPVNQKNTGIRNALRIRAKFLFIRCLGRKK
jgi:hypothetical protein